MKLYSQYLTLESNRKDYYHQYTYNEPILITLETFEKIQFIQKCMQKCIRHMALNYQKYESIMPFSDRAKEILEICNKFNFNPGTYRTDFIITKENEIKLIEITSRYALNGYFRSGFVNCYADKFADLNTIPIKKLYPNFFNDLEKYFGNKNKIVIVLDDNINEGKYYKKIFLDAGYELIFIQLNEIKQNINLLKESICIIQLTHEELFSLPNEVINAMMEGCILNDFRTVIIPHDKRFFALLYNHSFRADALGEELANQFKIYLTPTYTPNLHQNLWDSLKNDLKNDWIIKPTVLGKGKGIVSSNSVSREIWKKTLLNCDVNNIIFQPFLNQRRFNGNVGDENRNLDYVAGTLLFFQDEFYGPGLFRASNHAVTNQGDDRKIASAILDISKESIPLSLQDKLMII